jgi:hypothetical protein
MKRNEDKNYLNREQSATAEARPPTNNCSLPSEVPKKTTHKESPLPVSDSRFQKHHEVSRYPTLWWPLSDEYDILVEHGRRDLYLFGWGMHKPPPQPHLGGTAHFNGVILSLS